MPIEAARPRASSMVTLERLYSAIRLGFVMPAYPPIAETVFVTSTPMASTTSLRIASFTSLVISARSAMGMAPHCRVSAASFGSGATSNMSCTPCAGAARNSLSIAAFSAAVMGSPCTVPRDSAASMAARTRTSLIPLFTARS